MFIICFNANYKVSLAVSFAVMSCNNKIDILLIYLNKMFIIKISLNDNN